VACQENGKIVGTLMCGHDGRRGSIFNTAVIPEYQNHGIGSLMQNRSLNALSEIGIHSCFFYLLI
jgi:ribosomal protein S18 acetylase RimI-like enzyme